MVGYEIGDVVKIIHPGATYSTYDTMFKKLNFKNKSRNGEFDINKICTIFGITKHESYDTILYALRSENGECLVEEKAFILLKKKNPIYELW